MITPEIDASDIEYVEARQSVGSCLVRMRNDVSNAYNCNYNEHSGNPRRSKSPCAGIECGDCMFSNRNSDLDIICSYLSTFTTNNICNEDDLIMIL